jgi:hypothetical protein
MIKLKAMLMTALAFAGAIIVALFYRGQRDAERAGRAKDAYDIGQHTLKKKQEAMKEAIEGNAKEAAARVAVVDTESRDHFR